MKYQFLLSVLLLAFSLNVSSAPAFKYNWKKVKVDRAYYIYLTTTLKRSYRLRCDFWQGGKHLLSQSVFVYPGQTSRTMVSGRVGRSFTKLQCS